MIIVFTKQVYIWRDTLIHSPNTNVKHGALNALISWKLPRAREKILIYAIGTKFWLTLKNRNDPFPYNRAKQKFKSFTYISDTIKSIINTKINRFCCSYVFGVRGLAEMSNKFLWINLVMLVIYLGSTIFNIGISIRRLNIA